MRWAMAVAAMACLAALSPVLAASKADLSGKWHFVLQTEGGDREREATFQQQGSKVTGKWDDADVQGTFDDGKLDLEFPVTTEEVGKGTLKIRGRATEDSLTGTWEFQSYSGTFKATREH
jgi:hypothetical protein